MNYNYKQQKQKTMKASRPTIKELQAEIKALKEVKQKESGVSNVILKLPLAEANNYVNFINSLFIGDDRLKPAQHNFIEMIKRNNESDTEQPDK